MHPRRSTCLLKLACAALVAGCHSHETWTFEISPRAVKRIHTDYRPAPESSNLSPEAAKDKVIAEKLDRRKLLYTGRVVVDQDPEMLRPPESVATFEGEYYTIAKIAPKVEFGVIPATPRFFPESPDGHHRAMWANWGQSAYYPKNGKFYPSIGDNGS